MLFWQWKMLFCQRPSALRASNLPTVFVDWCGDCICTTSFYTSINGELLGCFKGKRGLRQGDPLSLLQFVITMNYLSIILNKSAAGGIFNHPMWKDHLLTHLSFVDDLLIFLDGTVESLDDVSQVLPISLDLWKCTNRRSMGIEHKEWLLSTPWRYRFQIKLNQNYRFWGCNSWLHNSK